MLHFIDFTLIPIGAVFIIGFALGCLVSIIVDAAVESSTLAD